MKNLCLARAALAASLIVGATSALAQGFGSISSGGPAWHGSQPPAAEAAPSPTPAPASVPATPQPAGFSSGAPAAVPAAAPPPAAAPEAPGSAPAVSVTAPAPESAGAAVPFGSVSSAGMPSSVAQGGQYQMADRVVVKKSERRLYLMRANQIVAEYPIRLGLNPTGHKLREGDFRTPEGSYELVRRNPKSEFFLSLEVSYPNEADKARAKQLGLKPGGLIMIHGQPNVRRKSPQYYENFDWTNGCIAVSNSDMVDIWLRTGVGTPIEIRP
jgi:lipoprotein-anchoring transpeptidase ErfK/SrfK